MKRWKKITYMVAIYKLLVELRPLDPYLTAFLTGPSGKVSLTEVITITYLYMYIDISFEHSLKGIPFSNST